MNTQVCGFCSKGVNQSHGHPRRLFHSRCALRAAGEISARRTLDTCPGCSLPVFTEAAGVATWHRSCLKKAHP